VSRYARACPRTAAARRICSRRLRRSLASLFYFRAHVNVVSVYDRTVECRSRYDRESSSRSSPLSDFNSRRGQAKGIFSHANACLSLFFRTRDYSMCTYECIPPRESLRSRGERRDAAIPSLDGKVIIYEPDLLGGAPAYSHGNRCRYCIHYVAV